MKDEPAWNAKLVGVVEKYACLYNFSLKAYSNRNTTDQAWAKVAKEMEDTVETCKETWRNLRVAFSRSLKKPRSGSAASKKKPYYLSDHMNFVLPYVNNRKDNLPGSLPSPPPIVEPKDDFENLDSAHLRQEADVDNPPPLNTDYATQNTEDSENTQEISRPIKKRKTDPVDECVMDYIKKKQSAEKPQENVRKLFLLSLQGDVDEMTGPQFRTFRRNVGILIEDIIGDQAQDDYNINSYNWPPPSRNHFLSFPSSTSGYKPWASTPGYEPRPSTSGYEPRASTSTYVSRNL